MYFPPLFSAERMIVFKASQQNIKNGFVLQKKLKFTRENKY